MRRKTKFFFVTLFIRKPRPEQKLPMVAQFSAGTMPRALHMSPSMTLRQLVKLRQDSLVQRLHNHRSTWPRSDPMGPALSQDSWPAGPDSAPEGGAALPRTTSPNGLVKLRLKTS